MKKYLLCISTILAAGMMGEAWADTLNCVSSAGMASSSRCDELGYIYTSSGCSGKQTLKCPFDDAKVWCAVASEKTCAVGDIVYSNNKCYASSENLPSDAGDGKGVVFDTENKLALEDSYAPQHKYMALSAGTNWTALQDNAPIDARCGWQSLKPGFSWLDKLRELAGVRNAHALELGGSVVIKSSTVGCKVSGVAAVLDVMSGSTEVYEPFSDFSSIRSTESDMVGYNETLALYKLAGASISGTTAKITTPAATYCMNLNDCHAMQNKSCPCTSAEQNMMRKINPYFLPRVGDLIKLARNYSAVSGKISIGQDDQVRSSTLAYTSSGMTSKYAGAWDVKVAKSGFPTNDTVNVSGYVDSHTFQHSGQPVRCIYYYGDNYFVNTANSCSD